MNHETTSTSPIIETGPATGIFPLPDNAGKPITVIGTAVIRAGFDDRALRQAMNSRLAPGVTDLVLNPDAHAGYGAPVGCVMASPTHIYPGPVGLDIKCSMSLLQLDIPAEQVNDRRTRRALIEAIAERTPTGAGNRVARKGRHIDERLGRMAVTRGASPEVLSALGTPEHWASRCEDSFHVGHDGTSDALEARLDRVTTDGTIARFNDKAKQLGSYGGGNHFGECEVVSVADNDRARSAAAVFGLRDGCVAFMSHCGSRGIGNLLAQGQFKFLQRMFAQWSIPLPGQDRELIYAPLGTPEANAYLDDLSLGANFATVNHMLINALVLEAFQEVLPGTKGELVYFISHNIARQEVDPSTNQLTWVHRKGATRAFPAGHHALKTTPFFDTGHPILLPGNPLAGSVVMVADEGAAKSMYSVNHGAGRCMSRKEAGRRLDQSKVDAELDANDILHAGRKYPIDEAPAAYKDFSEVLRSVKEAGLASEVASLKARFVIKDTSSPADD